MKTPIILATNHGLVFASQENGTLQNIQKSLAGHKVTSVIAREGSIIAGTVQGAFRSSDTGKSWEAINNGLDNPHVRWLAFHPDISDREFAGTEPAGLYHSRDGGDHWEASREVEELRDKHGWWLPYSPEDGCVRGFAFHGRRGYAAVEVGGVLRSDDGGLTWGLAPGSPGRPVFETPAPGKIHADVHSVGVHASSPDLVFAATNSGLYRSRDGGAFWDKINDDGYTRAFWVDEQDPDHIFSGPARGVGRYGTILETTDGGEKWSAFDKGLETPWPATMVERFEALDEDRIGGVLDDGRLILLDRNSGSWQHVLEDIQGINAITTMKA